MISSDVRFRGAGLGLLVWLAIPPVQAAGQVNDETVRRDRRLQAVRTSTPITIDGALDEAAWRDAPIAGGFLQSEPDEGAPASQQTDVRVGYDEMSTAWWRNNTDARQWSSNVRFNVIHRPLSDFYFVYNDRRDTQSGALIDRALIAKVTYLMAF
jgi:hypothetical protein